MQILTPRRRSMRVPDSVAVLHWFATGALAIMLIAICLTMAAADEGALTVRVTSPVMNADLGVNPTMTLAAEVTSPDGIISKVEFFDDDTLVGTVTQAPFTLDYHAAVPKLNYRITAQVTDAAGHVAVSPPVTCVAAGKVQRKIKVLYYKETDEALLSGRLGKDGKPLSKNIELEIPEGLPTVRGILVSTTGTYQEAWFQEFMYQHDFAFLRGNIASHVEDFKVMQNALQQFARESNHPELLNAPFVATGYSSGGGVCLRLLTEVPERVIGIVPVCCYLPLAPSPAQLQIPACAIPGGVEQLYIRQIEPELATYRPQGALYGYMTVQGGAHGRYGQEVLAVPYLDACVRLRYPQDADVRQGVIPLKNLDLNSGWVADNTTWQNGLTSIVPATQFHGDLGKSSWLPSEDIAFIYRAYSTYDRPLTITSPPTDWSKDRIWAPGANVTIVIDDTKFPGWQKLEFYDGAKKLGEITQNPPQYTATNLATGYHVFSVLGTDAQGNIRTSNPVLVAVRK